MRQKRTQSVGQPENGVHWEEQSAFTRVVNGARHIVVTLTDLTVRVSLRVGLGIGSCTPQRLCAAPSLLPSLEGDIP